MKKFIPIMALATLLSGTLTADDMQQNKPQSRPEGMRPQPPVYAVTPDNGAERPPFRGQRNEANKRRFEIMVLIHACRMMPPEAQTPIKEELIRRITADFQAYIAEQKARIEQAEADLERMRKEVAEREANADQLVAQELERLLKMPAPSHRNPPPEEAMLKGKGMRNNPQMPPGDQAPMPIPEGKR